MTFLLPFPILVPVKKPLKQALGWVAGYVGANVQFYGGALALPVVVPAALAGLAAMSAVALGGWLADATGGAILSELRRRARLRAPRPPSPSLRGTPTPEQARRGVTAPPWHWNSTVSSPVYEWGDLNASIIPRSTARPSAT